MIKKVVYGISFIPQIINEKIVMLKPDYMIEGICSEGNLIDKYDEIYGQISFATNLENYKNMYGLGVLEDDLLTYAMMRGFPESIKEDVDLCAKVYLKSIKKYVFFIEKSNGKTSCYAIKLNNKKVIPVDLNKSAITQLTDVFTEGDKLLESNNQQKKSYTIEADSKFVSPNNLYNKIIKRVIGQDDAAFKLSSVICKNIKYGSFAHMKSNVLLYGPTGCGKTELVRTLAKELNIPLIVEDMTHYTASGYVGDSVKSILKRLYSTSGFDMEKAEHGIIVLDEIDKLASIDSKEKVNKIDVQQELLKMLEGGKFNLNDGDRTNTEVIMDTSNIIFVLCGAFSDFNKKSSHKKNPIGFSNDIIEEEEEMTVMSNEDLVNYGLMSELVGRIHVKIPIQPLKTKELECILRKSSVSCLKIYETALLQQDRVVVVYDDKKKFINAVASKAEGLGIGARGLKSVVDDVFISASAEISDEYPNDRLLVISSDTVNNSKDYQLKKVKRRDNYELSKRNGKYNQ